MKVEHSCCDQQTGSTSDSEPALPLGDDCGCHLRSTPQDRPGSGDVALHSPEKLYDAVWLDFDRNVFSCEPVAILHRTDAHGPPIVRGNTLYALHCLLLT